MSGWQREKLRWAVQALAMPANDQVTLFPDFVLQGRRTGTRVGRTLSWCSDGSMV